MDLRHLETFLAIYRHGNLSRAAEELFLSQPAVSAHLKALETQVGRPLFTRQARGVIPTPAADTLARRTIGPMQALRASALALEEDADQLDRTVYIGGPSDCLSVAVLPALAPVISQGLSVRAMTGSTKELLERLGAGDLDLVVATAPSRVRGVELAPLFTETLALVAGPAWRDRLDGADPEALAAAPAVAYSEDLQLIRRYWRSVFASTPSFDAAVVLDDLRGVLELVAAGAGWTVIPTYLAARYIAAGSIVLITWPKEPVTNTLYLAVQRARRADALITPLANQLRVAASTW